MEDSRRKGAPRQVIDGKGAAGNARDGRDRQGTDPRGPQDCPVIDLSSARSTGATGRDGDGAEGGDLIAGLAALAMFREADRVRSSRLLS